MRNKRFAICLALLVLIAVLAGIDYCIFRNKYVSRAYMEQVVKQAYKSGIEEGMQVAIDGSIEAKAMATLFKHYRLDDQTAIKYANWVIESSIQHRIPSLLLAGLIMQESSCRHDAVSVTGAIGLTQVDWRWWGEFLKAKSIARQKGDLFNPRVSIEAGAAILSHLLQRYDGDIEQALKHYSGRAKKYSAKVFRRVAWLK